MLLPPKKPCWRAFTLPSNPEELPICAHPVPPLWGTCRGTVGSLLDPLCPIPEPAHCPRGPERDRVPPKNHCFGGRLPSCLTLGSCQYAPIQFLLLWRSCGGTLGSLLDRLGPMPDPTHCPREPESDRVPPKKHFSGGQTPSCLTLGSCQSAPNQFLCFGAAAGGP